MTGYTVHTGASKKFVEGWDRIFSGSDTGETGAPPLKKKAAGKSPKQAKGKAKPAKSGKARVGKTAKSAKASKAKATKKGRK